MIHWGWFCLALFCSFGAGLFITCLIASTNMAELRSEATYWKARALLAEEIAANWKWRRSDESERV